MDLTEEKIRAVKKLLRSGVPQGEIRNDLLREGYSEEELEKIFVPHRPDMRNWYLVFTVIFFLAGVYSFIAGYGLLLLVFSAVMFSVYYRERQRINKSSK